MKKAINTALILLVIVSTAWACMPERRLASKAIAPGDTINVCLMDPYMVLKQNLKTWEIEGYDTIPENVRDSLLYYHSKFIKLISDSSFIATYTNTVREELAKMNVHLFTQDSMSSFLASGGHAYLFNIAQMSVEEYMDPIRKTWALDTSTYWDIWCNAVGINVWYEASVLNDTSKKMQVLFGNMYVRDNINGKFLADFYTGEVKYEYTMDTITLKSVYSLAVRAGKTHAEYIFDYVMNDQMARKAKPGDPPTEYMHYDPVKKTYKKAGIHRFTVVK